MYKAGDEFKGQFDRVAFWALGLAFGIHQNLRQSNKKIQWKMQLVSVVPVRGFYPFLCRIQMLTVKDSGKDDLKSADDKLPGIYVRTRRYENIK